MDVLKPMTSSSPMPVYNPSIPKAEAGELPQVKSQCGLHGESSKLAKGCVAKLSSQKMEKRKRNQVCLMSYSCLFVLQ